MKISETERWLQGKLLLLLDEIIKEKKLPFDGVEQEVKAIFADGTKGFIDLVIWKDKKKQIPACIIELKVPIVDVYDGKLIEDALRKATNKQAYFFATWNLNRLVLWETFKPQTILFDRRLKQYDFVDVKRATDIERTQVYAKLKKGLESFLSELAEFYELKIAKPKVSVFKPLYPDEIMVYRLRSAIDAAYIPISDEIIRRKDEDPKFLRDVARWFIRQGWIFQESEEDFDRLARQVAYLQINKILFYNVLRSKFRHLAELDVSDVNTGEKLKERLQSYYEGGVKLGYAVIFASNFLEKVPIPDEALGTFKSVIEELNKYDFSKIPYDIIGKIFEKLIPKHERHKLGQYFTRNDVVDLILGFCIRDEDARVLDPACGSGTFLVRAYQRKKWLAKQKSNEKKHEKLLEELYGVDISKFPALLSEINLIIRDIRAEKNIPQIFCKDFFSIEPGKRAPIAEYINGYKGEAEEAEIPTDLDVVTTNPPYTRQEEMEHLIERGYKDRIRALLYDHLKVEVGKRSSIYSYFFFWGAIFLKEKGRMGLITSNSWLDVDYGKFLQEFFLKNFKIIAIIDSKVERWFEDADVNTAITILEKCSDKEEREGHLVKFVQLKAPLREFIPEIPEFLSEEREEKEEDIRWKAVEELVRFIEETKQDYEDEKIKIIVKKQLELWDEGYSDEKKAYIGGKWGKYIRAPKIFFKILKEKKDLFVPLKEIATVRFGIKTGANEFFYLPKPGKQNKFFRAELDEKTGDLILKGKKTGEEMFRIEKEYWMHKLSDKEIKELQKLPFWKDIKKELFVDETGIWMPNYVLKSPREVDTILANPTKLKNIVLMVHEEKEELKGKNILKYIEWGEEQGYHNNPTCASRPRWYDLGEREFSEGFWMMTIRDRFITFDNAPKVYCDARLYDIYSKHEEINPHLLIAFLNSIFAIKFIEILSRSYGGGGGPIDVKVYEVNEILVPTPQEFNKRIDDISKILGSMFRREIGTIFEELGSDSPEKVSLKKIKKDRRKLDKIIMGEILGLSDEEQLEIYRAVIDLVKSRIEKARSVGRKIKGKKIDIEKLAENVLKRVSIKPKEFPIEYLPKDYGNFMEIEIDKAGKVTLTSTIFGYAVKVSEEIVFESNDVMEAKYVYFSLLSKNNKIYIPKDKKVLEKAVMDFQGDLNAFNEEVEKIISEVIGDVDIGKKVEAEVERRMWW